MHDQTEAVGFLLSKLKLNGPTWEMIERSQRTVRVHDDVVVAGPAG